MRLPCQARALLDRPGTAIVLLPPPRWTPPPWLGCRSPALKRLSAQWGRGHDKLWSYPSYTRSSGRLHHDEVNPVHTATHLQGLVQCWLQIPRLSCHGEVSMGRVGAGQGPYGEPRDGEAATAPARGVRAAVRALWVDTCSYDRRALVICLYVPVALTLLEYMFHPSRARYWMPLTQYLTWAVMPFLWYFSGCLLLMVALPMVLLRTLGVRPRAMGVRLRGTAGAAPMYGVLYLLPFPTLVWATTQPAF